MKTWTTPEVSELNISATAQGKHISTSFDEIRVDQNGNYWVSFTSGADSSSQGLALPSFVRVRSMM